ncbi:MAG: hypothetical protein JNJ94_08540 [Chlorobi bacterium]|jgi:hypothetical protein|nr:hypothetical protein [Chlorobiota bacterium]
MIDLTVLPFTIAFDTMNGNEVISTQVKGILRLEVEGVVIEFRQNHSVMSSRGVEESSTGVQVVQLPIESLDSVELKESLIRPARFILSARTLAAFAEIPGSGDVQRTLTIARADRERARLIETAIKSRILHDRLERGLDHLSGVL